MTRTTRFVRHAFLSRALLIRASTLFLLIGLSALPSFAFAWGYVQCQQDVDGDQVGSGSYTSRECLPFVCTNPCLSGETEARYGLEYDNCPTVPNPDQLNTDGDSEGNACDIDNDNDGLLDGADPDDDNDGIEDGVDNCPAHPNADQADTDGDTLPDACTDNDDDNDGVVDAADRFPLNPAVSSDQDVDGFPGMWNASCDATCQANSGLVLDNCPSITNPDQLNTDGDAQGNECDSDDDNDGLADTADAFPLDNTQAGDVDADSVDGFVDNCPVTANTDQLNTDGDTQGNACDTDDDNDGVADASDQCPLDPACSVDPDSDGIDSALDNCPSNANVDQLNTDGDAQGNACDSDDDNDSYSDVAEIQFGSNPLDSVSNPQSAAQTLMSFESGVPAGWSKPATGNASWLSTFSQASHLGKSLRSGLIGHNQKAQIQFTANIASSVFTFDVKTSSEQGRDLFRVYVDGVGKITGMSGISNWQTISVTVTPGIHTIKFEYAKDGSVVAGSDAVWIDKLLYVDGTDTDSDGQTDVIDTDDDNDGLPDVMDPLPLQSKFNRDANYKGSQIHDAQAP